MSRSLTGGSRDVNPQYLSFKCTQTGADTTTTQSSPLPINKINPGRRPQIIEVLKVYFNVADFSEVDSSIVAVLTSKNFGTTAVSLEDPSIIAYLKAIVKITTSGQMLGLQPIVYDCTDDAGHGLLVATDNVYLQVSSTTTGLTNAVGVRILYRFKQVNDVELVTLLASQQ